ncbi:MAG: hypothetical protein JRJ40_11235, partial [Deltaproteobacteria bacterium]|nr:hypothetical protein [Deltaproteobacteria bacterium]
TVQGGLDVYVNPGDLGDARIGAYYNARGSLDMISLVNTSTNTGVVVKVRFREGKYSNEVLDFFVCLSAGDRWTAWVYGDCDTGNPAHLLVCDDDTPTYPDFGSDNAEDLKYSGTGAASCVTADMTKEGYFTIIAVASWLDTPGALKVVSTDEECGEVLGIFNADAFDAPDLIDAGNYLTGTVAIYDVVDGAAAYAYNMTSLADFEGAVIAGVGLGLDDPPTFADCQDGLNGVNYVLMKDNLIALYDIESILSAQSDVIITFPTKTQTITAVGVQNPFQGGLDTDDCAWDSDACEKVSVSLWDDEENSPEITTGFSPSTTTDLELCNEVNYIIIGENAASLLDTDLLQFKVQMDGFDIGWINFNFTTHEAADRLIGLPDAATPDATAYGLPVIGYELGSLIEGFYGHMLPLRYTSDIEGTTPD